MNKNELELKEDLKLNKIMELQKETVAKSAIELGVIDNASELNFRGFKLIFTTEDEEMELDTTITDESFDESKYER